MIKSKYKIENYYSYDNIYENGNSISFLSSDDMNYLIRKTVEYDSCIKIQTECVTHRLNTNILSVYYIIFYVYKKYTNDNYMDIFFETIPFFTSDNLINIFDKVKSLEYEIYKSYEHEINIHGILEK